MGSQLDHHIPALNLHRIHRYLSSRRTSFSRFWIPLPPVPRTNNLAVRNHALAKRAAAMQTDVVHGGDLAIHVRYANALAAAGKFFCFVDGREFGLRGKFSEHYPYSIFITN